MHWASVHHFVAHGLCILFSDMYHIFICCVLTLCSLILYIYDYILFILGAHMLIALYQDRAQIIGKLIDI